MSFDKSLEKNFIVKKENNKKREKKPRAVALLSGGLDSSLAVKMMLEQGIDVEAVAIKTPFCDFDCGKGCGHRVKEVATELNINLKTVFFGEEYIKMLKDPKYGYGSGMNPCVDCRSMMYEAAKEHMEKINADFIVTGEVLSQRPMSQHRNALELIEKETGMNGKILRPLSAKQLPITEMEKKGLVNRNELGDIKGRSRKIQLELAKKYNIIDPPNAAGGCLLTDPAFSKRVKDLIENTNGIPNLNDIELLKVGRQFRISKFTKLVVGRNENENNIIRALFSENDIILETKNYPGPTSIMRSTKIDQQEIKLAANITVCYSDAPTNIENIVKITKLKEENQIVINTIPNKEEFVSLMI